MAAAEYSLGIDLGQAPSPTAIARGSEATIDAPLVEVPAGTLDSQTVTVHRIGATVAQLVQREGSAPSMIVLSVPDDQLAANHALPGLVARHLGLGSHAVRLIAATQGAMLGRGHPGGAATTSAAALGAALSGAGVGLSGPLIAGAGGALAGGVGAALLADGSTAAPAAALGPTGVPLANSPMAGPVGTPLGSTSIAGPAGTPLAPTSIGPTGTPLGSTPMTGPTGTPLGPTGTPLAPPTTPPPTDVPVHTGVAHRRRPRTPVIAGAVAVVVVTVGAIALAAGGNDAPATAPTAATTAAPSGATTPDSSAGGSVPGPRFVADCVVGSWLADNATINSGLFSVLPASVSGLVEAGPSTGTITLDVAHDGTLTVTFDNFAVTAALTDGSAKVAASTTGKESASATFGDDGSFSADATGSDAQMHVTFNDAPMFDGPVPAAVVHGSGTYTCTKDQLQLTTPGDPLVSTFSRNG